jgi:hypothetical protein
MTRRVEKQREHDAVEQDVRHIAFGKQGREREEGEQEK